MSHEYEVHLELSNGCADLVRVMAPTAEEAKRFVTATYDLAGDVQVLSATVIA